ncbi:MAG: LysE family translocator [Candidatus Kapaibacteriota bacterium]
MIAFGVGLLIGYVLAIPPGPIGMAAMRSAVRDGWSASLKIAAGAGLLDTIYSALAMVATSAAVQALLQMEHSHPWAMVVMQSGIVVLMIGAGVLQVRSASRLPREDVSANGTPASGLSQWFRLHGPFFVGVGYAIANLANPTFVPALAAMSTFVQGLEWFEPVLANRLLFAVGFGLGNMAWLITLVKIVLAYRDRMSTVFMKRLQQISGFSLIGFGTFYGLRIIVVTEWHLLFTVQP